MQSGNVSRRAQRVPRQEASLAVPVSFLQSVTTVLVLVSSCFGFLCVLEPAAIIVQRLENIPFSLDTSTGLA